MKRRTFLQLMLMVTKVALLSGCSSTVVAAEEQRASSDVNAASDPSANYADVLFDAGYVHRIDVRMADEDWSQLLASPTDKTKYRVDVDIDGQTVPDVAFSTKGNSSLYFVAADADSSRYSFKLNFGKFVDGQTYHGLDKLCLNNGFHDPTNLKDYLGYQTFRKMGVPTPLSSFAWLTVNGQDRGLYTMVEDLGKSFLRREYGGKGVIYKPESAELALTAEMIQDIKQNGLAMAVDPHGADFVYADDNLASYPDIFENAETKTNDQSIQNVIAAMRGLAQGGDLSAFLKVDEIMRYFAVQNVIQNYDSYIGGMLHNLALCESEGMLSLAPWDLNSAYGSFVGGIGEEVLDNMTDLLNQGIDTPLIRTTKEQRPLWRWIVDSNAYRSQYHDIVDELIAGYYESGEFADELDRMQALLLPYVEQDPTAFYTAAEFERGCQTLARYCARRAESVRKQLDGQLACSNEAQVSADKVDASDINLVDMAGTL